jgi:hypothetical protein
MNTPLRIDAIIDYFRVSIFGDYLHHAKEEGKTV